MKRYSQLVRELPSRTVVLAIEDFNPPTANDELRFKMVDKLVEANNADHFVFVKESDEGLPTDRKIHFLNLMFGEYNYRALTEDVADLVSRLESTYKKVIVVSNNVKTPLKESTQVVQLDEHSANIKSLVNKGNYTEFKKLMPAAFRDIDCRLMMNEMRKVQGLEPLKEEVKFTIDTLRDKYFKGEIYHVGDIVESAGDNYEIMDRGTNYLVVVDGSGNLHKKWVKDVSLVESCWKGYKAVGVKKKNGKTVPNCVPEEVEVNEESGNYSVTIHHVHPDGKKEQFNYKVGAAKSAKHAKNIAMQKHGQKKLPMRNYGADSSDVRSLDEECGCEMNYKGYMTKNLRHAPELAKTLQLTAMNAEDPVAMLQAIKTTDSYLDIHNERGDNPDINQLQTWKHSHVKAKESLMKFGVFDAHQDQWIKSGTELDKMLAPHGLNESTDNYTIASDVLRYSDFMKLLKISKGQVPPGTLSRTTDKELATNISKEKPRDYPHTKEGHTLDSDDHIRRMKVMYHKEEKEKSITNVRPLPPELAPPADPKGVQATRDRSFSAFYEKNKKLAKKENADTTFADLMNYRIQKESEDK